MKRITLTLLTLTLLVGVISFAIAQNNPDSKDPIDQAKAMEEYMQMIQPGNAHERLNAFIGEWNMKTSLFMGEEAPPMEYTGTTEFKWALGNRFVMSTSKANMGGMVSEEILILGHDNHRNMYTGAYASSMSTSINTMTGQWSPVDSTLTFYGEMDEPTLKVTGRMVKYRYSFPDKDTIGLEVYDLHAGEDYRVVEVTFTRRQ